jgi:DNA primase catalytic core
MGAPIPEAEIHRVMQATDLAALIRSRGVDLVPHGAKDLIGRCPFHPEGQTPDLVVNRDNGLWHCLTCGKAGNAIRFVADHDGVSFRHAFELLTAGRGTVFASQPRTRHCTVPRLPCPLDPVADDVTLFAQVVAYYQERLKASAGARGYLAARGLDDGGTIERFQLGFADRSLGLRLSQANRKEGAALRRRLQALGLWRPSGHEHFNGCVVVPVQDRQARPVSLYGRRVAPGRVRDLYTPGPHRGLFNREAFAGDELILCGTVLDALTFWRHGFRNASALFGAKGFTDELWEALARVKRVRLAYGADEIGDRAAERDAERLRAAGIEVFRIVFPRGMGACEYARNVQPGRQSLAVLVNSAIWVGSGKPWPTGVSPPDQAGHRSTATLTHDDHPPNGRVPGPFAEPAGGASAIARVSADTPDPVAPGAKSRATAGVPPAPTALEVRGDAWFLALDGREYRVGGSSKTVGTDGFKVTLSLRGDGSEWFHLDQVDLMRDADRRRFIERAAEETGLPVELLQPRSGPAAPRRPKLAQAELARPAAKRSRSRSN